MRCEERTDQRAPAKRSARQRLQRARPEHQPVTEYARAVQPRRLLFVQELAPRGGASAVVAAGRCFRPAMLPTRDASDPRCFRPAMLPTREVGALLLVSPQAPAFIGGRRTSPI